MTFVIVLLACSAIFGFVGYRLGRAQGVRQSGKLNSQLLRELEFRDGIRSESRRSRTVTRSAHSNENLDTGRSRVRTMKMKR